MPRTARHIAPNQLVHVISRVADGRFLFDTAARRFYLDRLGRAVSGSDWRLLSYAIMSNHVHLALLSGSDRFQHWIHPAHVSLAQWVNRRLRDDNPHARGHVFAERSKTKSFSLEHSGILIAYQHNNPGRAGVVGNPASTTWTSHRAYTGRAANPPWLCVELGLALSGFSPDRAGRAAFHRFVCGRAQHALAIDRVDTANPVASASCEPGEGRTSLPPATPRTKPALDAEGLIAAAGASVGVPTRMLLLGTTRRREVVRARRIALVASDRLGRSRGPLCTALAISTAAASKLARGPLDSALEAAIACVLGES
jgi:hypothetical protein